MRKLTFPSTVKIINAQQVNKREKPKLLLIVAALAFGFLFPLQLFPQGEDCGNSIEMDLPEEYNENQYTFSEEQQSLFIQFQAAHTSIVFIIASEDEWPGQLRLYSSDCDGVPLRTQSLSIDSNGMESLSLAFYDLNIESNYIIQIERDSNSNGSSFNFVIEAIHYDIPVYPTCIPSPCPERCNLMYNGSFETAISLPSNMSKPAWRHENINLSRGWMRPYYKINSADYYHRNSSSANSQIPNNYFGTQEAVNGVAGNDAYAGMYILYPPDAYGDFREWMTGTLYYPLKKDHKYKVVYYVNLVDDQQNSDPCIAPGIKFSTTKLFHQSGIYVNDIVNLFVPEIQPTKVITDDIGWAKITGEFVAQGGEKYLTVSNFLSNAESTPPPYDNSTHSYMFIDEISIIDMGDCCDKFVIEDGWDVTDVLNAPEFAPYINGNVLTLPEQIKVEGDFRINQNFTIEYANLIMGTDGEIILDPNTELTLDRCLLDVCGSNMWNGITVDGSSSELIVSNSEIWKAKKGIHSLNGGKFTVTNTVFNSNYYGIYVDQYNGVHNGTVKGSIFRSSDYLLAPYAGQRAAAGIYLNQVGDQAGNGGIVIGGTTSAGEENKFYGPGISPSTPNRPGLLVGIELYYSTAKIYNNRFTDFLIDSDYDPVDKVCIKVIGPPNSQTFPNGYLPSIAVGGHNIYHNAFEKNYFSNSTKGLTVEGFFLRTDIIKNDFNLGYQENSTAIHIKNNKADIAKILVVDNNISAKNGIMVHDVEDVLQLFVDRNVIQGTSQAPSTGIFMNNIKVNFTAGPFTVSDNIISECTDGIKLISISGLPEIKGNGINVNTTIFSSTSNYGLRILNSLSNIKIEDNEIVAATLNNIFGISLEFSSGDIICNSIKNIGTGIQFNYVNGYGSYGVQLVSLLSNTMENNIIGLLFTNATVMGDIGNASLPSDNKWIGNFTNHTYADYSSGTIWTRPGGLPYVPQQNGGSPNPLTINPTASGQGVDCDGGTVVIPGTLTNNSSTTSFTTNAISFDEQSLSDTALWFEKYRLYNYLLQDSSINNIYIQQFKDSVHQSALGEILGLNNKLYNDSSFSVSLNELVNISASNHIESKMKDVFEIKLGMFIGKKDTLSFTDRNMLENIAVACPFVEGPAVYEARAILFQLYGKRYINNCELFDMPVQNRMKTDLHEIGDEILIYPNPTKNYLKVSIELEKAEAASLVIFDLNGREVLNKKLKNGSSRISTSELETGVYYYNLYKNELRLKTGKLVIL